IIYAWRVIDVRNRIAKRADFDALKLAWQHARGPLPRRDRLHAAAPSGRHHHDEARQIIRFRAKPVEQPRPEARPARQNRSVIHYLVGGIMVDLLAVHRADEAQVVGNSSHVREDLRYFLAGFPELLEGVLRRKTDQLLPLKLCQLLSLRERLRHRLAV